MIELGDILLAISDDVRAILSVIAVPLGEANPPETSGVYVLSVGEEVTYVGQAKGSKGLRDRLLNKHISGDDNHAAQRAYLAEFPDRRARRNYIRANVHVRWVEITDQRRVAAVERILIWLFQPKWNVN